MAQHSGRDVTQELDVLDALAARTDEAFALYVVQGPLSGAVFALEEERVSVGRQLEADLALHDEGVSRIHARFERGAASVTVRDLGSRNGTYVNGERIAEPRGLLDGDQIGLGHTLLRFAVQTSADIRLAQRVYEASIRDHLTGLYNRRYAEEQLHQATRHVASPYRSLCILHIEGLAQVNDEAGRGTGDELLRSIGTKLKDVFGSDDAIARWDGAELLVLSHEPEPSALSARLKALVGSVAIQGPHGPLTTTASAGATHLLPGASPGHLLVLAEQALMQSQHVAIQRAPGRDGRQGPSARYSLQEPSEERLRSR